MASDQGPLGGLRVVEHASGLAASYAGFLLAGLGADVVKVEAAATTRPRPGDHVLHRNKRSIDVDAAAWRTLVAGADAVVTDEGAPDVPADAGLVRCRVTAWVSVANSISPTMTSSGPRLSSSLIGGIPVSMPFATRRGIASRAAFSTTTIAMSSWIARL